MKKEMIKAIRMVNGLNPDLRVDLEGINRNAMYDWIEANRLGIWSSTHEHYTLLIEKPSWDSPDYDKYTKIIWVAVSQVISGKGD